MPKFHIDEVCTKDEIHPMIINFQNGYISEQFATSDCLFLEDKETGRKCVATELNNLIYSGEAAEESLGKTLILTKNRKTGKVKLIEVTTTELKPVLKFETEKADSLEASNLETSNLELSRKFGSKKQKKQMEQKEKLRLNVSTVEEQMLNVTENITEEKLDLSSYNKNTTDSDDFYIPPINRLATKVEDVYEVHKILTEEQFEEIYSELEGKDYKSDMLPFISNMLTERSSHEQIVLAVYANCLFKLYVLRATEIVKKSFITCEHSHKLHNIILDNFTTLVNNKRNRSMPYKEKSLCHALVFLLLANGFKFELQPLCDAVKITVNNASLKLRLTGASVTSGSNKMAQLKLPLNKITFRRKSAKF